MSASQQDMKGEAASEETGKTVDPSMARAEEMVDRLGERLGVFAAQAGQRLRTLTARAREEAEDIWAEAQHLRHNGQS